jgi:extracellular factor (EF) 3-hydroxypalmitic acid methyl ester biosynthesis protein
MATTLTAEPKTEIKESFVTFQTSQGTDVRAGLLRFTRHLAVAEVCAPNAVFQTSEVLGEFKILCGERLLYYGRAIVKSVVNTGLVTLVEATLEDSWQDIDGCISSATTQRLASEFTAFFADWEKLYRVTPEYKIAVADLQTFLTDARLWLEQVELGIRASPSGGRTQLEQQVARQLAHSVVPAIASLFERFESVAQKVPEELQLAHRAFAKRQIHPLLLTSPFVYRTFCKPLGYAGDYEVVNMMFREPFEGSSLFSKLINTYALQLPPIVAHRNRIEFLVRLLTEETCRVAAEHRPARIFSLGCGPAQEVQRFMRRDGLAACAQFTLLDFNDETLAYTNKVLSELVRDKGGLAAPVRLVKKSVQQLLRQAERTVHHAPADQYDFIYCAGLFDYLSDKICAKLAGILYESLAPGGLLLLTNVDQHPSRGEMECFLEWHLVYRTPQQLLRLVPRDVPEDSVRVEQDLSGVNIFLELRKPKNACESSRERS